MFVVEIKYLSLFYFFLFYLEWYKNWCYFGIVYIKMYILICCFMILILFYEYVCDVINEYDMLQREIKDIFSKNGFK